MEGREVGSRAATVVAAGLAILLWGMVATASAGDINGWRCNGIPSGFFCYDYASDRYKDWDQVTAFTQYRRDHVCAGSRTLAGNIKQGSSCSAGGTNQWGVNILYPNDPLGRGYAVWVGDGGPIWTDGRSFDN